jgi:hypothetical protein
MILIYGFLIILGLFVFYRLVQWWMMTDQLKIEGRDIQQEIDRVLAMRWEKK